MQEKWQKNLEESTEKNGNPGVPLWLKKVGEGVLFLILLSLLVAIWRKPFEPNEIPQKKVGVSVDGVSGTYYSTSEKGVGFVQLNPVVFIKRS